MYKCQCECMKYHTAKKITVEILAYIFMRIVFKKYC